MGKAVELQRAYSVLDITTKAEADGERIIEGIATTPTPDRMGDIVEPLGAEFAAEVPLLWQHRHDQPIGWVKFGKPTKAGIPFKARMAKIEIPGALKDRLDEAWQTIWLGLVKAVSIGFRSLEHSRLDDGSYGLRFIRWELLELSAVTIPANADATITTIRSIDTELRATLRPETPGQVAIPPGPPAALSQQPNTKGAKMPKTIAEQIAAFKATRDANDTRMDELMSKSAEEGVTLTVEEGEEYDTLAGEQKSIDVHIERLKAAEARNVARAVPPPPTPGGGEEETPRQRAAYGSVTLKQRPEKGVAFTRLLAAKYLGQIHYMNPADVAKRWTDTPEVEAILRAGADLNMESLLKSAIVPGSTTDTTFAEPLVQLVNATNEFVELLRPREIIGRIPGFDRVPFNTQVPRETGDPTAYWVGQAQVKPLSRMAFDKISLTFAKVAGIVPMTEELMKFSNPSAELRVRNGLVKAIAYLTDRDFLDPTKAEQVGVSPASVTNGVTPITASGTTADALRADLGALLEDYAEENQDIDGLVLVMTPMQAVRISLMRNTLGGREFDGITRGGGELEGIPVVTSTNIAATGGSPVDGYPIVAINASDIYLAEEGVAIDLSREATLQMESAPDSPVTGATQLVSLWQQNMVAIKAERYITWKKKRDTSVKFIQNAKYTG